MDYHDKTRLGYADPEEPETYGPCIHCGEQAVMSLYPYGAEDEIEVCRECYEAAYQEPERQEPTEDDVPF